METNTPKLISTAPSQGLSPYREKARAFASNSKSEATKKAYAKQWERFDAWTLETGETALPASPLTVAGYIAFLAEEGIRPTSINLAVTSISQAHKLSGHESPTSSPIVRETLKGIRRHVGTAVAQKEPLVVEHLQRICGCFGDDLIDHRNRALLLVGFAGAFRRSELVALTAEDISEAPEGLRVVIRRSKTDQEGAGRTVGIPFGNDPALCPVRSLRAWLTEAGITSGEIFRGVDRYDHISARGLSGRSVARIIKGLVEQAGYDPAKFSGHSLRAGLATAAAAAGKSERAIMNTTGHRSVSMVRRYIRQGSVFRDNAADGLL